MSFKHFLHRNIFILFLILVFSSNTQSQTRIPSIIGSNMVLQQMENTPIWGWDIPGKEVTVKASWTDDSFSTTCNSQAKWQLTIPTPAAGGPYEIRISGSELIILDNILIGEVWLCSGQSNMEMPLKGWSGQPIKGSDEAIAASDNPEIRLFTVERKTSYEPLSDCEGSWVECSPQSSPDFSATAYFFGIELYKELGIPVGLIHSSWGGTPAEAWTSSEFISKIPFFQSYPGECNPMEFRQKKLDDYQIIQNKWLSSLGFLPDSENPPDWVMPEFKDKYWEEIRVPAKWEDTRLGKYQGMVEFRMSFKVPRKWLSEDLVIELGPIDEIDISWVNGVKIGSHPNPYSWNTPRVYDVPEVIINKRRNSLAIQVGNTSGAGGIFGSPEQLRIYPKGNEKSSRQLKGKWLARKSKSYGEVIDMPWCNNCGEPNTPTTLYNGMINPLIPFRIKGAIWYQGESNRYDGKLYGTIFPNMIMNWRNDWNQGDFPFYYVQIAPYTYRDEFSTGLLREAQLNTMSLSSTGMVVTMDIGDLVTIHPPDKENVGKRLAYWALANNYDKDIPFSGPVFREYRIEGDKIRIIFDHAENGLKIDGQELKHIFIAGRDREFLPATARIEGNTLLVLNPEVKSPVAVRFGWGSTDETNLFNNDSLPAGPFRTDRWEE